MTPSDIDEEIAPSLAMLVPSCDAVWACAKRTGGVLKNQVQEKKRIGERGVKTAGWGGGEGAGGNRSTDLG